MRVLAIMLFVFSGCTGAKSGDSANNNTAGDSTVTGDSTDTSGTNQDTDASDDTINMVRNLDTCGESVADDVPEPYKSWFVCANLSLKGNFLSVFTSGLPPHPSSYYPTTSPNWVAWDDRGGAYTQNPNNLSKQSLLFSIPLNPTPKNITITADMVDSVMGTNDDEYQGGPQGLGLDGTVMFNSTAAKGDDIFQEQYTFDVYSGHPAPDGTYHHHGANEAALAVLKAKGIVTTTTVGSAEIEFFGVMCDGTVVLGCTELDGSAPTGTLDAQNGHVMDMKGPDGTVLFTNRYHTHDCAALGRTLNPEIQYYDDGTCIQAKH